MPARAAPLMCIGAVCVVFFHACADGPSFESVGAAVSGRRPLVRNGPCLGDRLTLALSKVTGRSRAGARVGPLQFDFGWLVAEGLVSPLDLGAIEIPLRTADFEVRLAGEELSTDEVWGIRDAFDQRTVQLQLQVTEWGGYYGWIDGRPLCGVQDGEEVFAYVVPGRFDEDTTYRESIVDTVTFVCGDCAGGKCLDFYADWASGIEDYRAGRQWISLGYHFRSCIRALRNDICGDGTPHTSAGILIQYADTISQDEEGDNGVADAKWGLPDDQIEATFGPTGATCIAHDREGVPPQILDIAESCDVPEARDCAASDSPFWPEVFYQELSDLPPERQALWESRRPRLLTLQPETP